ncbi:dephospho-CoA kinase [Paludisphaera sp.]|uniref:dephospho-CoA kinase n=1 Tax=Paludisphaera sp. TaxID=2017432 RepID=UPI00301BAE81
MPESSTTIGHPVAPASRADRGPIPVVGVIGGIGGGKSSAAAALAARGAVVIDADAVGHETLRRPEVARRVAERFGPAVVAADGSIDRRALGRVVFADASARRDLESIVHPPMFEEFGRRIAEARALGEAPLIVLDAAILLEAGWDRACDAVVFVDAPREIRLDRVRRGRGWSDEDLSRREAAQWPLDRKKAGAGHVLVNDGDAARLESEIDRLMPKLIRARGS